MKSITPILALIFTCLVVGLRFLPHPVNFSPTLALMIYLGFVGRENRWLWLVGPLMIFASDLALGLYDGISFVYLSYALSLAAGFIIGRGRAVQFGLAAVYSSVIFFTLSNLGVWQFTKMYPHDQAGLVQCFVMALPFFHNTLFSTLAGVTVMITAHRLSTKLIFERALQSTPQEHS